MMNCLPGFTTERHLNRTEEETWLTPLDFSWICGMSPPILGLAKPKRNSALMMVFHRDCFRKEALTWQTILDLRLV